MKHPMNFQVHLTNNCNLKCLHCYSENADAHLTRDRFDYILNEVLDYIKIRRGTPHVAIFCGGEPTLSPIFFDSIRKCAHAGFERILVLTNGVLITDTFAQRMAEAGCTAVQICIEGNRETHNHVRSGTWQQVLKAWEICRNNGMFVHNQTTVTSLNYEQIDDVVNTCRGRVHRTSFLRHIPHKNNIDVLTSMQWLEVLERIFYGYCNYGEAYRDFVRVRDIYWNQVFFDNFGGHRCGFMEEHSHLPIIEYNGDVYICRRSGIVIGNIFNDKLVDIYRNSEVLKKINKGKSCNGRCVDCGEIDSCGGCRAMAFAVNKDIQAKDPHCVLALLTDKRRKEIERLKQQNNLLLEIPIAQIENIEITTADVVGYLKIMGSFSSAMHEVTQRKATAKAAKKSGIKVTTKELQKAAGVLRTVNGLSNTIDTDSWLDKNRISNFYFEDYLETNVLIHKFKRKLTKKVNKDKYIGSDEFKESLREMAYEKWRESKLD